MANSGELDNFLRTRRLLVKRINLSKAHIEREIKKNDEIEIDKLETYINDEFENLFMQLSQNSEDIFSVLNGTDEEQKKIEESVFREESIYMNFRTDVKSILKKLVREKSERVVDRNSLISGEVLNQTFRSSGHTVQPKLKDIEVPKFRGDVMKFQNFKALFENLIHNREDLSNVQKLHYLKEALSGDALEIIINFELCDSAYPEAWKCLLDRFDGKKIIKN